MDYDKIIAKWEKYIAKTKKEMEEED